MQGAVNAVVGVLLAVSAALATAAGTMAQTGSRNANGFTVASVACLVAAMFLVFAFYALHPALRWLGHRRLEVLERYPKRQREPRRRRARERRSPAESLPMGLVVEHAIYGDQRRSDLCIDVTEDVRKHVVGNRIDFVVSNAELGGDPAPNVLKTLLVEYAVDRERAVREWQEGTRALVPPTT